MLLYQVESLIARPIYFHFMYHLYFLGLLMSRFLDDLNFYYLKSFQSFQKKFILFKNYKNKKRARISFGKTNWNSNVNFMT